MKLLIKYILWWAIPALHCTVVVASTTNLGSVRCTGYYMGSMETITAASLVMLIIVANTALH
jgi:hypothetical protein